MWFKKVFYIIAYGLDDVEELEKVEIEKIVKIDILRSEILLVYLSSNIDESTTFIVDWSFILPILPFSFGLFANLGISDIIEISLNIWLGF